MATQEPPIFDVLRKIRYDLTAAQAKVTDALTMLAAMNLPTTPAPFECKACGAGLATERALSLHMQNVHDGPPVPLDEAEQRA